MPEPRAEANVLAGWSRIRLTDGCVTCRLSHEKKFNLRTKTQADGLQKHREKDFLFH